MPNPTHFRRCKFFAGCYYLDLHDLSHCCSPGLFRGGIEVPRDYHRFLEARNKSAVRTKGAHWCALACPPRI